jgi:Carboxypeptidase regulatory-like domain
MPGRTVQRLLFAAFAVPFLMHAQETRSTVLGRITDPTGAVILGAVVEAKNLDTGVHASVPTNASGDFLLPFLIPGPYSLTVSAPGFKKWVRSRIQARIDDRLTIDVTMEIGQATESVQVTADAPLLDTSTGSMGQVIDSRKVLELPLIAGNVTVMANLSPGVLFQPTFPKDVRPFDTGSGSAIAGDGTRIGAAQFQVDGAMNNANTGFAYSPPPGVVEEVKVQTASFDASSGFLTGVTVNMSLKSGTNHLHGQTYYFNQNPVVAATPFFLNRVGTPKLTYKAHRWGGNTSGPVYLPKLYDGRNKTFWMYGYEGWWSFDPVSIGFEAVPTPAQRKGDFSGLLALGARYQIYDPYSIAPAAGGLFSRQPLPNNIIPANRLDPLGTKIAQLYDAPNLPGTVDGVNNYTNGRNSHDNYYNHIARVDHHISVKQRFYARVNATRNYRVQDQRHSDTVGHILFRYNRGAAVDHVYTVSPSFLINSRYSYTRYIDGNYPDQDGWDLAGLGFSSTFVNQIKAVDTRALRFPQIAATGYSTLSVQAWNKNPVDTHDFALNATKVAGTHSMRFGGGYRIYRRNSTNLGNSSGVLSFATNWTRGPLDTSAASPIGQGMASLLYGLPTGGSFPIAANYAEQVKIFASYFQDDWRVSRKLTLSWGLRYELPSPMNERFNRSVKGFDFDAASPIEAAVKAAYAANPIPQIPAGQFQVRGGLTYPGVGGQTNLLWNTNKTNFMPRISFAYSITSATVFRGGYGIYFEPIGVPNQDVIQTGFSQTTNLNPTLDNGLHFIATLANPFPSGFLLPLGSGGGLSTNLGQSVSFFAQNGKNPYVQRWQFALQRSLPGQSVLEVSYVGNRGVRQRISRNLDSLPNQYLSTSPLRDQATINLLAAQVPNPFYPLLPGTNLSGTTVARSQLLVAYPQFTGVSVDVNQGYSWYHSMQSRFEKRFSGGFTSSVSWTWSKLMEARSYLNGGDPMPEKVISDQDRTQRFVVTAIYELPLGKGKRVGGSWNGLASRIISGWQASGIYQGQSGAPLGFGNAIFLGNLHDIPIANGSRTVDRWFNPDAGFERNSALQPSQNLRILSSRFSGIRSDGANNLDLAIIKNTQLREGVQFQLRFEAINALNHPQFNPPNTTPSSSAFGQVTETWASPRTVLFAAKILF